MLQLSFFTISSRIHCHIISDLCPLYFNMFCHHSVQTNLIYIFIPRGLNIYISVANVWSLNYIQDFLYFSLVLKIFFHPSRLKPNPVLNWQSRSEFEPLSAVLVVVLRTWKSLIMIWIHLQGHKARQYITGWRGSCPHHRL